MLNFKAILVLLFSIIFHTQLSAQNLSTIENDSTITEIKFSQPLNLRLHHLDYLTYPFIPDYWDTYANSPKDIIIIRYAGLHKTIYQQILSPINKYYTKQLKDYWSQSYLDTCSLERDIRRYQLESSDKEYRWWERSWIQSLALEKGGAKTITHTIGRSYEILEIGPISLKNTGKVSLEDWKISFSNEEDIDYYEKNQQENLSNIDRTTINSLEDIINDNKKNNFTFGISPPRGNLYSGNYFTMSGGISINILLTEFSNNGSSLRGILKILGNQHNINWLEIEVEGNIKPFRNDYSLNVSFIIFLG